MGQSFTSRKGLVESSSLYQAQLVSSSIGVFVALTQLVAAPTSRPAPQDVAGPVPPPTTGGGRAAKVVG